MNFISVENIGPLSCDDIQTLHFEYMPKRGTLGTLNILPAVQEKSQRDWTMRHSALPQDYTFLTIETNAAKALASMQDKAERFKRLDKTNQYATMCEALIYRTMLGHSKTTPMKDPEKNEFFARDKKAVFVGEFRDVIGAVLTGARGALGKEAVDELSAYVYDESKGGRLSRNSSRSHATYA